MAYSQRGGLEGGGNDMYLNAEGTHLTLDAWFHLLCNTTVTTVWLVYAEKSQVHSWTGTFVKFVLEEDRVKSWHQPETKHPTGSNHYGWKLNFLLPVRGVAVAGPLLEPLKLIWQRKTLHK